MFAAMGIQKKAKGNNKGEERKNKRKKDTQGVWAEKHPETQSDETPGKGIHSSFHLPSSVPSRASGSGRTRRVLVSLSPAPREGPLQRVQSARDRSSRWGHRGASGHPSYNLACLFFFRLYQHCFVLFFSLERKILTMFYSIHARAM